MSNPLEHHHLFWVTTDVPAPEGSNKDDVEQYYNEAVENVANGLARYMIQHGVLNFDAQSITNDQGNPVNRLIGSVTITNPKIASDQRSFALDMVREYLNKLDWSGHEESQEFVMDALNNMKPEPTTIN